MTKEQIRLKVIDYLNDNPSILKEFATVRSARLKLEADLNLNYPSYDEVTIQKVITEVGNCNVEAVADDLMKGLAFMGYGDEDYHKEQLEECKNKTDEDCYIYSVFDCETCKKLGTFISTYKSYQENIALGGEHKEKVEKIYNSGLAKREQHIKHGREIFNDFIARFQAALERDKQDDMQMDEIIPRRINDMIKDEKTHIAMLNKIEYADGIVEKVFDLLGQNIPKKQAQKIDKIIEMNDATLVNNVLDRLKENPTKNFIDLGKVLLQTPAQNPEELKWMKALDVAEMVTGTILTATGIFTSTLTGNISSLSVTLPGFGLIGLGFAGINRHIKKAKIWAERDRLVSCCVNDFLHEVEVEKAMQAGLTN